MQEFEFIKTLAGPALSFGRKIWAMMTVRGY
jgi:hypothetical protein